MWEIKRLTCSPDGQTVAFFTNDWRLYVARDDGILYQRPLEPSAYYGLSVANNGTAVQFEHIYSADAVQVLVHPDFASYGIPFNFDTMDITSSGAAVWSNSDQQGVTLVSPSGEVLMFAPFGLYGVRVLPAEQFFIYVEVYPPGFNISYPASFLVDIKTGNRMRISAAISAFLISGVLPFRSSAAPAALDQEHAFFECTLTFRPQILLADYP